MRRITVLIMILIFMVAMTSVVFSAESKELNKLGDSKRNITEEKNRVRREVEKTRKSKVELEAREGKTAEEGSGHGEAKGKEGEEGAGHEGGLPINFPGWQIPFAIVATIYYALALKILPLIIEKKSESGGHH